MAKDKSLISVYVPQEIKERLEKWAGEEDRSVSYIVGRLIVDALDTRDQRKQPPAATPPPHLEQPTPPTPTAQVQAEEVQSEPQSAKTPEARKKRQRRHRLPKTEGGMRRDR
jgi:type IV secretory pathway VirB10-like protein